MEPCSPSRHLPSAGSSSPFDEIPAGPTRPPGFLAPKDPELHIHAGGNMGPGTWKRRRPVVIAASLAAAGALALAACGATGGGATSLTAAESPVRTTTPIKHLVVLFDENISFDHYFGTYPKAATTDGTRFPAKRHTPKVDGLSRRLLTKNPNQYNPTRLTHEQALTCDQDHSYGKEQLAVNGGKMD